MNAIIRKVARRVIGSRRRSDGNPGAKKVVETAHIEAAPLEDGTATWPAPFEVHAWVIADDRVTTALAKEWRQTVPAPATWRDALQNAEPDLVVVGDHVPPAWTAGELAALLDAAARRSVPRVGWFTAAAPARDVLGLLDAVLAPASLTEDLRGLGVDPVEVPPSASPHQIVAAPPRPAHLRTPRLAHADDEPLADEVARRLASKPAVAVGRVAARALELGSSRGVVCGPHTPGDVLAEAALAATPVLRLLQDGHTLKTDLPVRDAGDARALRSEAVALMNQGELVDRDGHLLRRAILRGGTYRDRAADMLRAGGLDAPAADRSVSFVAPTNRAHELDNVLENASRQRGVELELVLVLHGVEVDEPSLKARARDLGLADVTVIRADRQLTLGTCMNLGVDAAQGRWIAKVDDDNYYGTEYASDLVDAFRYTDAKITGKWAHYTWLRSSGAVVLRYPDSEHCYERRVQGGSMMFDRDLVKELRFSDIPRAVDSDILDRAAAAGARIYSADRYNFVSVRGSDRMGHTWTVEDSTFLTAKGDLRFFGDPREHVSI